MKSLIDRIGLKLLEQPLTLEDILNLVNYGSNTYSRGEVRVELNHLLASQMVTAKVIHNKDTYLLTKIGRRWAEGARDPDYGRDFPVGSQERNDWHARKNAEMRRFVDSIAVKK